MDRAAAIAMRVNTHGHNFIRGGPDMLNSGAGATASFTAPGSGGSGLGGLLLSSDGIVIVSCMAALRRWLGFSPSLRDTHNSGPKLRTALCLETEHT